MYQDKEISMWILDNITNKYGFVGQISKILSEINSFGQMWLVILIVLLIYEFKKNKKFNFNLLLSIVPVLLMWILCEYGIKNWVNRPRPYQEIEGFLTYIDSINYKHPSGASFPSGHTLVAFASAFIISCYDKKYLPYAYIIATLVALSRLILGAHYLSDIFAGIGLGTVGGSLGVTFGKFFGQKLDKKVYKEKNNEA